MSFEGRTSDERIRICAKKLDSVLTEPALHFADRMAMLFRVEILVAKACVAPLGLGTAVAQDRIEENVALAGETGDRTPHAVGKARERVVQAQDDDPARANEPRERRERGAWVGRVVQHTRALHDVESASPKPSMSQIGFDERCVSDAETPCGISSQPPGATSRNSAAIPSSSDWVCIHPLDHALAADGTEMCRILRKCEFRDRGERSLGRPRGLSARSGRCPAWRSAAAPL